MQKLSTKQFIVGFTLVELSIVIIIIGFLIAGISAGQSLIKQAQLNAIITESSQYATGIHTFKARYGQLPGDFNNAYAYWGTNCAPDGNPVHCNGNGDDYVQYSAVPPNASPDTPYTHEGLHAWQHLSLANLIAGNFTGIAPLSANNETVGGQNAPFSKYQNGIWMFSETNDIYGQPPYTSIQNTGNFILIGAAWNGNNPPVNPLLTPADAQSIDTKIDDGFPFTGTVFSENGGCITGSPCTGQCTNGNTFQLQVTTPQCITGFFYDIK